MPEPAELVRLRSAMGRATIAARRDPSDPFAAADLAAAREAYEVALTVRTIRDRLGRVTLSMRSRTQLFEAISSVGALPA